jgi:Trp operon repressor
VSASGENRTFFAPRARIPDSCIEISPLSRSLMKILRDSLVADLAHPSQDLPICVQSRRISENLYNLVISLLQQGETVREVAKTVGVSISTVSRIGQKECSDRILHKGGRPQALLPADKRYCVRMITKGKLDNAVVKVKKCWKRIMESLYVQIL